MTYRKHPLIYVRFWDHATGPSDTTRPIICEIFGILKREDSNVFYVASWICDENLGDSNTDIYCILKSTVVDCRQITDFKLVKHKGVKNESKHKLRIKRKK